MIDRNIYFQIWWKVANMDEEVIRQRQWGVHHDTVVMNIYKMFEAYCERNSIEFKEVLK